MNRTTPPLGRNDPCWCGSGRKFKKCHMGDSRAGRKATVTAKRDPLALPESHREAMRVASRFNAALMDHIRPLVRAGVTTEAIDRKVQRYTEGHGHVCATIGYHDFPKACCTSVNEVVCHGIPDGTELRDGDIVNVDLTTIVNGWHGDQSETFIIGEIPPRVRELLQVTFECLWHGIHAARPNGTVNEISVAITEHAHREGFTVVRDFQGHGLGQLFHQEPSIPHYPTPRLGKHVLAPGQCFTIEPMINIGGHEVEVDDADGWTVRTKDGTCSAQFEHTILMTETGPEVLTITEHGPQEGHRF